MGIELAKLVPPPEAPLHLGRYQDVRKLEAKLGIPLPDDYVDMAVTYGSGAIKVVGRLAISFINPFDPDFLRVQELIYCFGMRSALPYFESDQVPAWEEYRKPEAVFPDRGGLLPILSDDNSNTVCFWMQGEDPNRWPVFVTTREERYEVYDMPLCTFLLDAFERRLDCLIWESDAFFEDAEFKFDPYPLSIFV